MPSPPTHQTPVALALVLVVLAATTGTADDNLTLEKAINGIAKNVARLAKERDARRSWSTRSPTPAT